MFGQGLYNLRKEKKLTQQKLADTLNEKYQTKISKSMISRWEKGLTDPQLEYVKIIADYFNINPLSLAGVQETLIDKITNLLLDLEDERIENVYKFVIDELSKQRNASYLIEMASSFISEADTPTFKQDTKIIKLKFAPWGASAGLGNYMDDIKWEEIEISEDEIPYGVEFGILIDGDSMEPSFPHGSIALVEPTFDINIGDIGIFQDDHDIYIKEAGESGLISHNSAYPIMLTDEYNPFRILGKVKGVYTEVN